MKYQSVIILVSEYTDFYQTIKKKLLKKISKIQIIKC